MTRRRSASGGMDVSVREGGSHTFDADALMEFRILGPLEVVQDGKRVPISAPREQVLLAMLVLEANRVVPVNRLIDAIWDGDPPETARRQVQICVSSLRKTLGAAAGRNVIITRAPGYQLDVPDEAIDAARFNALAAAGRAAAGDAQALDQIDSLRAALALWRGSAAAGIESPVVQIAATRLNEQRLMTLEECIGLEISRGNHAEVIGELAALVKEHPLRERLRAYQMVALYQAGRQADALAVFREVREVFMAELGIDPGEELARLERAILRKDPELIPAPPGPRAPPAAPGRLLIPRQLPADIRGFTGRREVIDQLCDLLTGREGSDWAPGTRVALVTGMSGVGKTALAVHVGHLVQDSFPDGQLFIQLSGDDGQPVAADEVLQQSLRAIGAAPGAIPDESSELTKMYRSLLATRRILVILDDVASFPQVMEFLPGGPNCAVIVTSRRRMVNLTGARSFEVGVLPQDSAQEMLSSLIADSQVKEASDQDIADLAELCGYLPLALRIVAAKLSEYPHWTVRRMADKIRDERSRLAELQVDSVGVEANISLTYKTLSVRARTLFLRLALLGSSDFGSWVCAPLLETGLEEAEEFLDELVAGHLVEVRHPDAGRARFQLHELVRAFTANHLAAEQSGQEQDNALRRLLACWLFLVGHAHSAIYGGEFVALHGTAPRWPLPAHVVDELTQSPMAWFRAERRALLSAIGKAAASGLDEACWDLATTSVAFFEAESLFNDWSQTHELALDAVCRVGNARGEAAVLCSLGELAYLRHLIPNAADSLTRARAIFDAIGDVHGRALASGHLAFLDRLAGRGEEAIVRYAGAVDDLRSVGDKLAAAHLLCGMAQACLEREEYDAAELYLVDSAALCAGSASSRVSTQVRFHIGEVYLGRGALRSAEDAFRSVLRQVRASEDRTGEVYALYGVGAALARRERYGAAFAELRTAQELASDLGDRLVEGRIWLALGEVARAQGRTTAALAACGRAEELFRQAGAVAWQDRVQAITAALRAEARDRDPGDTADEPRVIDAPEIWLDAPLKHLRKPLY